MADACMTLVEYDFAEKGYARIGKLWIDGVGAWPAHYWLAQTVPGRDEDTLVLIGEDVARNICELLEIPVNEDEWQAVPVTEYDEEGEIV